MNGEVAGALAYRLVDAGLHVIALATDPMWQRSGVGSYLVAEAELARQTADDSSRDRFHDKRHLPALYFYQRRGIRRRVEFPTPWRNTRRARALSLRRHFPFAMKCGSRK